MSFEENLAEQIRKFENLPYHKFIGLRYVDAGSGYAEIMLTVKKEIMNANGVLHGGMYYTLCDLTASAALEADVPAGHFYVTHDINVSIISSVSSGEVKACGEVLKAGKRMAFVEIRVYNEQEELLAVARITKTLLARKPK